MKLFALPLLFLSQLAFSQKTIDTATAPVKIIVTDMKKAVRSGEQIIMKGKRTGQEFSGISDKKGEIKLRVRAGDTYTIKIKAIGPEEDNSQVIIPPLFEGEKFAGDFVLTIRFEPAKTFTLNNVHFDSGKSTIRQESIRELQELLDYLKRKPEQNIEIAGHTDNIGADADNQKLSQEGAESIKAWLVKKGIAATRLTAKGYGASQPVADNGTAEGKQKNRRTEVRLL